MMRDEELEALLSWIRRISQAADGNGEVPRSEGDEMLVFAERLLRYVREEQLDPVHRALDHAGRAVDEARGVVRASGDARADPLSADDLRVVAEALARALTATSWLLAIDLDGARRQAQEISHTLGLRTTTSTRGDLVVNVGTPPPEAPADGELVGMGTDEDGWAEAEPGGAEVERGGGITTVRRTPHLTSEPERPPSEVGAEFTVEVTLDEADLAPGESGTFVADAPEGATSIPAEVFLVASEHFTVQEGQNPKTIHLPVEGGSPSDPATFTVVRAQGSDDQPATISASFLYKGRPCGVVVRTFDMEGATVPDDDSGFVVDSGARVPDLTVVVTPHEAQADRYEVAVFTPHLEPAKRTGTWALAGAAAEWVTSGIESTVNSRTQGRATAASLLALGPDLFLASPTCFQEAYWALVDSVGAPKTMLVQSSDAVIPWELMVPYRDEIGTSDLRALGVSCAIGRWHVPARAIDQQVPLDGSVVVCPPSDLETAETEAAFVSTRYRGAVQHPEDIAAMELGFVDGAQSLLHFICHGAQTAGGRFSLLIGTELMEMGRLRTSSLRDACRSTRPFVFINACEAGGVAEGITSVDGFGPMFVSIGARVVIAPMWPANDRVAHDFALAFYQAIDPAAPRPLAEIVSELRGRAYATDGADTWAAYCFYGDPNAVAVAAAP